MAKRARRRTRSRNRRRQPELGGESQTQFNSAFPEHITFACGFPTHLQHSRASSADYWQNGSNEWHSRRLSGAAPSFEYKHRLTSSTSSASSIASMPGLWTMQYSSRPSTASSTEPGRHGASPAPHGRANKPAAELSVVEHRLRMFGGNVDDGLALCEPMMKVVRGLFDGKLDYLDP